MSSVADFGELLSLCLFGEMQMPSLFTNAKLHKTGFARGWATVSAKR